MSALAARRAPAEVGPLPAGRAPRRARPARGGPLAWSSARLLASALLLAGSPSPAAAGSITTAFILTGSDSFLAAFGPGQSYAGVLQAGAYTLSANVGIAEGDSSPGSHIYSRADLEGSFQLAAPASVSWNQTSRYVSVNGAITMADAPGAWDASFDEASASAAGSSRSIARVASSIDASGVRFDTSFEQSLAPASLYASAPGASGMFSLQYRFVLSEATAYSAAFDLERVREVTQAPAPGWAPTSPVLPGSTVPVAGRTIFQFQDATDRAWFDPPTAYGYEYRMTGPSLFTSILDFPLGFEGPFTVVAGGRSLGVFGPGSPVDFVALTGAGVSSFQILGIDPGIDAQDPGAFPVRLAFDTATASFEMEALAAASVPEPASIALAGAGAAAALLRRRRAPRGSRRDVLAGAPPGLRPVHSRPSS